MEFTDKKTVIANRIFYSVIFLLIIGSVAATYIKIAVLNDYQITAEVSCGPAAEKCFVWECDPADDSACPEDPAERVSYYKIISKNAAAIAACQASQEKIGCQDELSCAENEPACSYTNCDPASLLQDEECSN